MHARLRADVLRGTTTDVRARAQSLLSGTRWQDGSTWCPPLSLAQAHDVLAWATATTPPRPSTWRRVLSFFGA